MSYKTSQIFIKNEQNSNPKLSNSTQKLNAELLNKTIYPKFMQARLFTIHFLIQPNNDDDYKTFLNPIATKFAHLVIS